MENIMKKTIYLLLIIILFLSMSNLNAETWRVKLKDKGQGTFSLGSALYEEAINSLNQKSLDRRKKHIPQNQLLVSMEDVPINTHYVSQIKSTGAVVLLRLKWMNYLVVSCDSNAIEKIKKMDFVLQTENTSDNPIEFIINNTNILNSINAENIIFNDNYFSLFPEDTVFYGYAYTQIHSLLAENFHNIGVGGNGIILGITDTGFKFEDDERLPNDIVKGTYDFIYQDTIVSNQELNNDVASQTSHGTLVFSVISAMEEDSLIGIAPKADIYLAKTENMKYERHIEEDNYAAALEWLESKGVDIISTSLGYRKMNDTSQSYIFDDLDGHTTLGAKYANLVSKRGVICFLSAGNNGPKLGTMVSPGDADSIISVGALLPNSLNAAKFSSRGPLVNGNLKPDIATQGVAVMCIYQGKHFQIAPANGTSLAAPLAAGGAALLLSTMPHLKSWEFKKLIYENASHNEIKDSVVGWGQPNYWKCFEDADLAFGNYLYYPEKEYMRILIYINNKYHNVDELYNYNTVSLRFGQSTKEETYKLLKLGKKYLYGVDIPLEKFGNEKAICYFNAISDIQKIRKPYSENEFFYIEANKSYFPFHIDSTTIPHFEPTNITENTSFINLKNQIITRGRNIDLYLHLPKQNNINITITNFLGQKVYDKNVWEALDYELRIESNNLNRGIYIINVNSDKSNFKEKFIIAN